MLRRALVDEGRLAAPANLWCSALQHLIIRRVAALLEEFGAPHDATKQRMAAPAWEIIIGALQLPLCLRVAAQHMC